MPRLTQKNKVLGWNTRPYTLHSARFALLEMSPDIFGARCASVVIMCTFFFAILQRKQSISDFGGHTLNVQAPQTFFFMILNTARGARFLLDFSIT